MFVGVGIIRRNAERPPQGLDKGDEGVMVGEYRMGGGVAFVGAV